MQKTKATRRARALLDRRPRRVQGRAGKDKASELRRISRKKQHAGLAKGERGGGACRHKQRELQRSTEFSKKRRIKTTRGGHQPGRAPGSTKAVHDARAKPRRRGQENLTAARADRGPGSPEAEKSHATSLQRD